MARPSPAECANWQTLHLDALHNEFCSASGSAGSSMETDTDLPGLDYRNFLLPRADPLACLNACAVEPICRAWTYVNPPNVGMPARCRLKSSVPPPVPNACCTSGLK